MKTQRKYLQNETEIEFKFTQNKYDFMVEEIPLFTQTKNGNVFILKIKKTFTSTWELISHIAETLDIDESNIGYAGLKDKSATTIQYISIPLNRSRDFKDINTGYIKVLETFITNKKIKIGDLKANKFKITLKDIKDIDLPLFYQKLSTIQKHGIPNYFGYQRFGKEDNFEKAKDIVYGEEVIADKKLNTFMKISYQSYFFNSWLAKRVELAKEKNLKKIPYIQGDLLNRYDHKTITGLMPGRDVKRSKDEALEIEKEFDDMFIHDKGSRRDAWIQPSDIKNKFIPKNDKVETNQMVLEFTLPKSSYATVFIEALSNKNYGY